ncbi:hypothetical protein DS62_04850 [Smithella sp. SC_K08D17]|jgi:protein tyrosine phosphatase|nr:hypothetical protein DS62_04850 [Smithella sp. SC_K08D17]
MINYLKDVEPNERCVCVFITQILFLNNLTLSNVGISESGIWKLNMTRMIGVTKVVVYYRHDNINEIIVGDYLGTRDSKIQGRHYIKFKIIRRCQTLNNWKDFCNTGSNPVRYT